VKRTILRGQPLWPTPAPQAPAGAATKTQPGERTRMRVVDVWPSGRNAADHLDRACVRSLKRRLQQDCKFLEARPLLGNY